MLHLLEKIYNKFFKIKYYRNTVVYGNKLKTQDKKRLVFYLNYPKFIHFGDTLWFEPIIRFISKYFEVAVYCNPSMEFYFKGLGYNIIQLDQIASNDIIISRLELVYHLRKLNNVVFINFEFSTLDKPLITDIILKIRSLFESLNIHSISHNNQQSFYDKPLPVPMLSEEMLATLERLKVNTDKKYVIFNNYLDSHSKFMTEEDLFKARCELYDFVREFKVKNDVLVIHTGSKLDLEKDAALSSSYDFVDLDLRGKTSIFDLFGLAGSSCTSNYIGFDTFWLHLFNLYNKDSYIKLKPGATTDYNEQVKNFVIIPYTNYTHKVYFL